MDVLARAPAAEVFLEGMNAGTLLIGECRARLGYKSRFDASRVYDLGGGVDVLARASGAAELVLGVMNAGALLLIQQERNARPE